MLRRQDAAVSAAQGPLSVLYEAAEQRNGLDQQLLLFCCELGSDRLREPALAPGAVLGERRTAALADADQDLATVGRVGRAVDEGFRLEVGAFTVDLRTAPAVPS